MDGVVNRATVYSHRGAGFSSKDMINMIKLDYKPKAVCWIHQRGQAQAFVAV